MLQHQQLTTPTGTDTHRVGLRILTSEPTRHRLSLTLARDKAMQRTRAPVPPRIKDT